MVYYADYQSIGPNGFNGIEKTGGPNKIHLFYLNDGSTIPNDAAFRIFLCPLENMEIHCIDMQKGYDYLKQQIVCWAINHLTRTEETSAIILTKEGDDYAACKAFAYGMHKSIYTYPSFADVKAEHMNSKRRPFPQNTQGTTPRPVQPLHIVQNETKPDPKPEEAEAKPEPEEIKTAEEPKKEIKKPAAKTHTTPEIEEIVGEYRLNTTNSYAYYDETSEITEFTDNEPQVAASAEPTDIRDLSKTTKTKWTQAEKEVIQKFGSSCHCSDEEHGIINNAIQNSYSFETLNFHLYAGLKGPLEKKNEIFNTIFKGYNAWYAKRLKNA